MAWFSDELIFPELESPVEVSPDEAFVAPAILDVAHGEAEAKSAIAHGLFRPTNISGAELDRVRRLYVPFWRVDAGVDGFHLGVSSVTVGSGKKSIPLPTGGANPPPANSRPFPAPNTRRTPSSSTRGRADVRSAGSGATPRNDVGA